MICNRPLTEAEKKISQRQYMLYCGTNGFSYMCLGETVLILFAVQMKCSDTVAAVLGAMIYIGFLMLPLGKWMTARRGAAASQADFWVMRNFAAILVALAAPAALFWNHTAGVILLLAGSFFFYGFRAAGVVMSGPLVGEIVEKEKLGGFIARSLFYFYSAGLVSLIGITLFTKRFPGLWTICGVIVTGSLLGIISSTFLRKIRETSIIRDTAKESIAHLLPVIWHDRIVRRQIVAGMVCNLCTILIVPICILSLKRGCGVSDARALLYSFVQIMSSAAVGWLLGRISDRFGGRNMTIACFYVFYPAALFWVVVPGSFPWWLMIFPFLSAPFASVGTTTALSQYFLVSVEKKQQVVASMLVYVATGVLSGLLGIGMSSVLLKTAAYLNKSDAAIQTYRLYFLFVLVLLPVLGIFVHRLVKVEHLPANSENPEKI